MNAYGLFETYPTTAPWRTTNGISFDLRFGDVVQPLALSPKNPDGSSAWYFPPYFRRWLRFYVRLPILPWISIRVGRFGMYAGAKCFGVEPAETSYLGWFAKPDDLAPGSKALMLFTMRFTSQLQ